MDLARIMVRMALWVRRPPSRRHLIAMAAAVVLVLVIVAIEQAGYWPDALTLEPGARHRRLPGLIR